MTDQRHGIFRARLADRDGPLLGTWVKLPATESVELIALAGFDFIVIDMEHSPLSIETVYRHIGTALEHGVSPIVRVPGLDAGIAQRLLDAGAEGIMVPHVDTVADARAAVAATRFPPLGARGVGATSRAGAWGALARDEYLRFGREEVVLIAQLESGAAVIRAREIGAVEGVDALLLGAADLALSEGIEEFDPAMAGLVDRAVAGATSANVPIGSAGAATAAAVEAARDAGFAFVLLSNDASLLGAAAREAVRVGRSVRYA